MGDFKKPNLNKNSDKYFVKKKLSLRRRSKSKLIKESFIMLFFSILIIYLNYLVPNKISIFNNLFRNLSKIMTIFLESFSYVYEICLAILIMISTIFAAILMIGSFSRLFKVVRRKTKFIKFK